LKVGKYLDLIKQSDGPAVSSKQVAGADLDDIDLQLDPALIVAAIEAASRTPALDGIALEHFARAAVDVNHILAEAPAGRRAEAAVGLAYLDGRGRANPPLPLLRRLPSDR
jgi:hypothetical protein